MAASENRNTSYIDEHGDWETRKISIVGALSSFISQLSIGDELTKISLPSILLFPFSSLELGGVRGLGYAQILLEASKESDPIKRFISVLRWYLSYTQKETFKRKPYNPILGETHVCWIVDGEPVMNTNELIEGGGKKGTGVTKYFAEQTSHHPPIMGFIIENKSENVFVQANLTFGTKYYGNSAFVSSTGQTFIEMRNHKHGNQVETYTINKTMPDISIRNMILPGKRIAWEGDIAISCEQSDLKATFTLKEEGWSCVNTATGSIVRLSKPDEKLFTFNGPCGDIIKITELSTNKTDVLLDCSKLVRNTLYYLPYNKLEDLSSVKVWAELNQAIVENDMQKADAAKKMVEDAQRKRRNEGTSFEPRFFVFDSERNFWKFDESNLVQVDELVSSSLNDPTTKGPDPVPLTPTTKAKKSKEKNKTKN